MGRVTMLDVAKRAGVDKATVSRVVKGDPRISDKTHSRVMEAIKELDYHIDKTARNLSTNKSYLIGIVIGSFSEGSVSEFIRGADRVVSNTEYELMIKCTEKNPGRAARELARLYARGVDGVIWCDAANRPSAIKCSFVTVGFKAENSCSVFPVSGEMRLDFNAGVLSGRLIVNLIQNKPIPSKEILIRNSDDD